VAGVTISGPDELTRPVRVAIAVLDPRPVGPAGEGTIRVEAAPELGAEAYELDISPGDDGGTFHVRAGDAAGACYAAQTLRQLLPPEAFRAAVPAGFRWTVPCGRIADAPRFAWRGVLLDVARHFLPKREVLRLIDLLAAHKLNRLHLHLADDQGWRVESRAYPLLHELASHRPRTITSHYGEEAAFDEVPHGGYYTLADLTEIAAYARDRAVTVVPEIDVPGHASAILAAYPAFGADPGEPHDVLDRWGISPAILAPLPATIGFLGTVFDEILDALGPGTPYFHIGGDECVLDAWAASPKITAHQRFLGLRTPG
jgi:hexosaminidase